MSVDRELLGHDVFIPVAVDAVRVIEGEEMIRVTYFVVTTDAPGSIWEVELPSLVRLHGIGLLGMAGVVYSAVRSGAVTGEEVELDLFTDPSDIAAIFALEEPGAPFSVQVEDVWMPQRWFEDTPVWGGDQAPGGESEMTRGDVFRVGVAPFREAYRYTAGELGLDQLLEVDAGGRVLASPVETAAVRGWSEDQIEAARRAFPQQPLKLRWRS